MSDVNEETARELDAHLLLVQEQDEALAAGDSRKLKTALRGKVDTAKAALGAKVVAAEDAKATKEETTGAAGTARKQGIDALSRVQLAIEADKGRGHALLGRYGLAGENPTHFLSVLGALEATRRADDAAAGTDVALVGVVRSMVEAAITAMTAHVTSRAQTAGAWHDLVDDKDQSVKDAREALRGARDHLASVLPAKKQDAGMRYFGFNVASPGGRPRGASDGGAGSTGGGGGTGT